MSAAFSAQMQTVQAQAGPPGQQAAQSSVPQPTVTCKADCSTASVRAAYRRAHLRREQPTADLVENRERVGRRCARR